MTALLPIKNTIQTEEVRFRAAVSEAVGQRLGETLNFIAQKEYSEKQYFINGIYASLPIPFTAIDGLTLMGFNATLINAFIYIKTAGTSGDTELDIEYNTAPGPTGWTSIFTTKPKINFAAGDYAFCYVGSTFVNTTAPVFSTTNLDQGWVLRCNITSAQAGGAISTGLCLHYQPR